MNPKCYILYSKNLNKFYVGATNDTVQNRLEKHNCHTYGKHRFTAATYDWEVFLVIDVNNYSHAIRVERKIKSMKSKIYIRNLKRYPELIQKLLNQTST